MRSVHKGVLLSCVRGSELCREAVMQTLHFFVETYFNVNNSDIFNILEPYVLSSVYVLHIR